MFCFHTKPNSRKKVGLSGTTHEFTHGFPGRTQEKRWFKNGQKWRTGCEGRISVVKRRHGMNRCRYKGDDGMKRWVGLGVIADNLINIGHVLAARRGT